MCNSSQADVSTKQHWERVYSKKSAAEVSCVNWTAAATQELITLLRDDYPALMAVLSALRDVVDSVDAIHSLGE